MITAFSFKYCSENYYKAETIETLPAIIARNESEVVRTKAILDNDGKCFGGKDQWEEVKGSHYRAMEFRAIAKAEYIKQLDEGIYNAKQLLKQFTGETATALKNHIDALQAMKESAE